MILYLLSNRLTNSMEHSTTREANSHSTGQEITQPFMESEGSFITVFTRARRWSLF